MDKEESALDRAAAQWRKGVSARSAHRPKSAQTASQLSFGALGSQVAFSAISRPGKFSGLDDFSASAGGNDSSGFGGGDISNANLDGKFVASVAPGATVKAEVPTTPRRLPKRAKKALPKAESEESWRVDGEAANGDESSLGASAYGASDSASSGGDSGADEAGSETLRQEEAEADHANALEELRQLRHELPGGERIAGMVAQAFADESRRTEAAAGDAGQKRQSSAAAPRSRAPVSVPHAGAAAGGAALTVNWSGKQYLTLERVKELNVTLSHGIRITDRDRINLEDTSCASSSSDSDSDAALLDVPARRTRQATSDIDSEAVALQRARELFPSDSRSLSLGSDGRQQKYDADAAKYFADCNDDDGDDECGTTRGSDRSRRKRKRRSGMLRQTTLSGGFADGGGGGGGGGGSRSGRARQKGAGVASTKGRMNSCFLCRWGNHEHDVVNNEHMEALLRMIYENIGEIPPEYIALAVHKFYMCVLRPAALRAGQELPVWRSRDIFICITTHNQDPQIRLARDLDRLETVQRAIESHIFYQQMPPPPIEGGGDHAQTPAEREMGVPPPPVQSASAVAAALAESPRFDVNLKAVQALQGILRMKYLIAGVKLPAMAFYQSRRDIKLGGDRQFHKGLQLKNAAKRRAAASRLRQ